MPMPPLDEVTKALNATEPEAPAPAAPPQTSTPAPAAAAPVPQTPASNEPSTPPASTPAPDVTALVSEEIQKAGARAFFEALPEDVKERLGAELYPGLHRVLSKRTTDLKSRDKEVEALKGVIEQKLEEKFDEFLTTGLDESGRKEYFARKAVTKALQPKPTAPATKEPEQPAAAQPDPEAVRIAEQKFDYAWSLIESAGLPRDPRDPRVQSLDFAWDEPDFDKAMQRLARSVQKVARTGKPIPPATAPANATAPVADAETVKKLAAEMAEQIVTQKLKDAGLLSADTSRAGTGAGGAAPTTMSEAKTAARKLIEETLRAS